MSTRDMSLHFYAFESFLSPYMFKMWVFKPFKMSVWNCFGQLGKNEFLNYMRKIYGRHVNE